MATIIFDTDDPGWDNQFNCELPGILDLEYRDVWILHVLTYCNDEILRLAANDSVSPEHKFIWGVVYATKIGLCVLWTSSKRSQKLYYGIFSPIFDSIQKKVSGRLYALIQEVEFLCKDYEPCQAPKGWVCSICMCSKNNHLTIKTACSHFFHYGCFIKLLSPMCPMCRQEM